MPNRHETLTSLFSDIADAIRFKTGDSDNIVADNFDIAIRNIPSGGAQPKLSAPTYSITGNQLIFGNNVNNGQWGIVSATINDTPVSSPITVTSELVGETLIMQASETNFINSDVVELEIPDVVPDFTFKITQAGTETGLYMTVNGTRYYNVMTNPVSVQSLSSLLVDSNKTCQLMYKGTSIGTSTGANTFDLTSFVGTRFLGRSVNVKFTVGTTNLVEFTDL